MFDFGERLSELRKKKHLTQTEAGRRLNVTRSTISAYERNIKTPSVEVLIHMAVLYNVSLDYMTGLDKRTNVYLDDLSESQQQTIIDIINRLKSEFKSSERRAAFQRRMDK